MVELGHLDICTEVSMLSSILAMPRRGHMESDLHLVSYLQDKHNSRIPLNHTYSFVDRTNFVVDADWIATYGDVSEALPTNIPSSLARRLLCACLLILIMLVMKSHGSHALASK